MTSDFALTLVKEGFYVVLLLSTPVLLASLLVGFFVSLLQATTQIQDQTLTFVPKLLAVMLTLVLVSPWMGATLVRFAQTVMEGIALMR